MTRKPHPIECDRDGTHPTNPTQTQAQGRPRTSYAQEFLRHIRDCRDKQVDPRFLGHGTAYQLEAILADYIQLKGNESLQPAPSESDEAVVKQWQAELAMRKTTFEEAAGIAFTIGKHTEDRGVVGAERVGADIRDELFRIANAAPILTRHRQPALAGGSNALREAVKAMSEYYKARADEFDETDASTLPERFLKFVDELVDESCFAGSEYSTFWHNLKNQIAE